MSKIILSAAAILCFGTGIATTLPAMADAAADARKTIEGHYAKMSAAINKKDIAGYTQFYAEDIVIIGRDGQQKTKQQAIAAGKQVCQMAKSIKIVMKMEKFALKKDKAVVTLRENAVFVMPNPQTNKEAKMAISSLEEFIWVKSGGGWKIKRSKELTTSMTLDGKPVKPTSQ